MSRKDIYKDAKGFDKHPENINRKGQPRKVSIKRELEKLLQSDGIVKYTGNQIVDVGEVDGVQFVKIKVPTMEALANKMISIAMGSNKNANTLRALIQLLEQFDGKAQQTVNVDVENAIAANINDIFGEIEEDIKQKKD